MGELCLGGFGMDGFGEVNDFYFVAVQQRGGGGGADVASAEKRSNWRKMIG